MRWLHAFLQRTVVDRREPDFVVGSAEAVPYLRRWWLLPHNKVFNIYLHNFCRSDDDRALHDHPWFNLSILLDGSYTEHTIAYGGINIETRRTAGTLSGFKLRSPWAAHRVELDRNMDKFVERHFKFDMPVEKAVWTIFITGPYLRRWGFHCRRGWVWSKDFDKEGGCGDLS